MGKNRTNALQEIGIDTKKADLDKVNIEQIYFHPPGHPLRHPRADDPVDEALRDDIVAKGVQKPVVVRLGYVKNKPVIELLDGCCRTKASLAGLPLMREADSKLLDKEGRLFVPVRWFKGDDKEFLKERQRADTDEFKRRHSIKALCVSVLQMSELEIPVAEIVEIFPRGWTRAVVDAVKTLWHTCSPELMQSFDRYDSVPPGILPAVLSAPPGERIEMLEKLVEAGVKSVSTATRHLKAEARRAEAEAESSQDGDDQHEPETNADRHDATRAATATTNGTTKNWLPPKPKGPIAPKTVLVQAVHSKTVRKCAALNAERPRVTKAETGFFTGAVMALNDEEDDKALIKALNSLPEDAVAVVCGYLWRRGIWTAAVQKHASTHAIETIENAATRPRANKEGGKKSRKGEQAEEA